MSQTHGTAKIAEISILGETQSGNFRFVDVLVSDDVKEIRIYAVAKGGAHGNVDDGPNLEFVQKALHDANQIVEEFFPAEQAVNGYTQPPHIYRSARLFVWVDGTPFVQFSEKEDFNFSNYNLSCDKTITSEPYLGKTVRFVFMHANKSAIETEFNAYVEVFY